MSNVVLDLMPPISALRRQDVTAMRVIDLFEGGAENVYLMDETGHYMGVALQRKGFRLGWDGSEWQMKAEPLVPVRFDLPISEAVLPQLEAVMDAALEADTEAREFLIVSSGGAVVSVARKKRAKESAKPHWQPARRIYRLLQGKEVFLSSLHNDLLSAFLDSWAHRIPLKILTQDDMMTAFSGSEDVLLIYGEDIYPDGCRKMDVREFIDGDGSERRTAHKKKCFISSSWASISLEEQDNLPLLVRRFDEGFQSVHVTDNQGHYLGSILRAIFREKFLRGGTSRYHSIYGTSEYSGDEAVDLENVVKQTFETGWKEVPLLRNGKVAANGVVSNVSLMGTGNGTAGYDKHTLLQKYAPHWEIISDEVAREFLAGRKRIMLSSVAEPWLSGFRERFASLAEIVVYNGRNFNEYLSGEADMLVYGGKVWPIGRARLYEVVRLYSDLLAEEMRRYFDKNGISYYACNCIARAVDWQQRMERPRDEMEDYGNDRFYGCKRSTWQGLREDYCCAADDVTGVDSLFICGRRQDAEPLPQYVRSVFVFGPCFVMGDWGRFGHTIEARLQEKCLSDGKRWRIVNCGVNGGVWGFEDLNSLNMMMDTHMRRGDIVIQMCKDLWRGNSAFPFENLYDSHDVFDRPSYRTRSYWYDAGAGHVREEGYAVWAEFLYEKIKHDPLPADREAVQPFSHRLGEQRVKNPELRDYLTRLAEHRRGGNNGAIVMNANPFTLGHAYLIEQARRQVDHLYVFVVEEDASEIPFADRMAIVQTNCASLTNVEVLPSGRYMISQLTFTEYFTKESNQSDVVFPSQDVRLFGDAIAPTLGIVKRFVGEEPLDNVTRQYNEVMKLILPEFGIELVEMPRKKCHGQVINATQVRKWIKAGQWQKCERYLSRTTLSYLRKAKGF